MHLSAQNVLTLILYLKTGQGRRKWEERGFLSKSVGPSGICTSQRRKWQTGGSHTSTSRIKWTIAEEEESCSN
jgi:hypothetical protein